MHRRETYVGLPVIYIASGSYYKLRIFSQGKMINPSSFNLLLSLGGWRLADRLLCYLCSLSVYLKQIVPWKMIGPHGLELIPARAILQGKKKKKE